MTSPSPEALEPDVMSGEDLGQEFAKAMSVVESPEAQAAVIEEFNEALADNGVPAAVTPKDSLATPDQAQTQPDAKEDLERTRLIEDLFIGGAAAFTGMSEETQRMLIARAIERDKTVSARIADYRPQAEKGVRHFKESIRREVRSLASNPLRRDRFFRERNPA